MSRSIRIFCTILALAMGLGISFDAIGQAGRKGYGINKRTRERLLEEAAKNINDAKVRQAAEDALRRTEEIQNSERFEELKKAAEEAVVKAEPTPEQMAQTAVAKALLEDAVQNVSDEAAKIINAPAEATGEEAEAQPAAKPAAESPPAKAPAEGPKGKIEVTEAPADPPKDSKPSGALPGDNFPKPVLDKEPQPVIPPPKQMKPAKKDYTQIQAKGGAFFHASQMIIVFKNDVQVDHKVFDLNCDQLEVFLYKGVTLGGGDEAEGLEETKEKDAAEEDTSAGKGGSSDIMKAIATGYVVITKSDPDGVVQVGKCRHATYDDTSGDLTMRGMPQVQRGTDLLIATDESTKIVFTRAGDMEVHGPHRMDIVKEGSEISQSGTP